jgi:AcrR family transcriptional regulator
MARILKEKEYANRQNEIIDTAQRLIYTKGYDQMTIQDILDDLHISKGAFYHYFDSKLALLDALIDHTFQQAEEILLPIVQDSDLSALEKLQRFFNTIARWKTTQKEFLLAVLRIWYADENALVRQKQLGATIDRFAPLLAHIVRQGVQEGVFHTAYPDSMSELLLSMFNSLGDTISGLLLTDEPPPDALSRLENITAAYLDALERILGAPPGSIYLIDTAMLKEWVASPRETVAGQIEKERTNPKEAVQ